MAINKFFRTYDDATISFDNFNNVKLNTLSRRIENPKIIEDVCNLISEALAENSVFVCVNVCPDLVAITINNTHTRFVMFNEDWIGQYKNQYSVVYRVIR